MDDPVGNEDRGADALWGCVLQRLAESREQPRAVIAAGVAAGRHETRFDIAEFRQGLFERGAGGVRLRATGADGLAVAGVEHDGDDALLRLAFFVHERRIGEREQHEAEREPAPSRAPLFGAGGEDDEAKARHTKRRQEGPGQQRGEGQGEVGHLASPPPQPSPALREREQIRGFITDCANADR